MKVTISKPAKSAMQSGKGKSKKWLVSTNYDQTNRSLDEVMGWVSADNTLSQLNFQFDNKEDAIIFCQDSNYEYEVIEPKESSFKHKSYTANFLK